MLNMLVVEDNVLQCQQIINYICKKNENIRLYGIAYNGEDALKMISSKNIDLIILDLNLPKISGISLLNIIKQRNFIQYKNSIIIITGENISKKTFFDNNYIYSIFQKPLNVNYLINSVNNLVLLKDEKLIRNHIIEELKYIGYNFKYNGTKYLIDTIYELYLMKGLDSENLSKNIYPLIAKKYNKSVNNIHTNIKQATKYMYRDCDSNILKNYFCFYDDVKPTEKQVIYTILNKLT